MRKDERPVELVFRKGRRVKIGGRSGPDIDAVDLDSLDRSLCSPALAAAYQDRQAGGSSIDALCSRVEVVGCSLNRPSLVMTARPPMRANSVGGTSFATVCKAPTRRYADPSGPSTKRISPDTKVALRIPTLEYLPTPAAVLSQVQCHNDVRDRNPKRICGVNVCKSIQCPP